MNKIDHAKPFLRWAGGKRWLIKYIDELLKDIKFNNYHEPFLGGGAIFFNIQPKGKVFLSDCNNDLINAYQCVKLYHDDVYNKISVYVNSAEEYYKIRSLYPEDDVERAARFIYLNQTSFNGLYRVNRQGKYNVPYGHRKRVSYNYENLKLVKMALENADLFVCDFESCKEQISKGDLVYLDPPYVVGKEDGFIAYNQHLFSLEDQRRLSQLIDYIKGIGAYYILSYSSHHSVKETFDKGDKVIEVFRSSSIGGKEAFRGRIAEYIFTNI